MHEMIVYPWRSIAEIAEEIREEERERQRMKVRRHLRNTKIRRIFLGLIGKTPLEYLNDPVSGLRVRGKWE